MTPSMTRLVQELMRLPGIGEKTAGRLAFHVLRADRTYAEALAQALLSVKDETRLHPEGTSAASQTRTRQATESRESSGSVAAYAISR